MQSQHIQVFVRCRPLNQDHSGQRAVVDIISEENEIRVIDRSSKGGQETKSFCFDEVFGPEATQTEVYRCVVQPLIHQVLQGYNCTVFAYGQTGTGKTYTMEGQRSETELSWEDDPTSGIIPRAISQIFDTLKDHENEFKIRVSFLELYNEDTYDLLSGDNDITKLKIFDDVQRKGSVKVGGLEEITVQSKAEIYDIMKRGSAKRQTASTLLNACSSRSHSIFTINVDVIEDNMVKKGKLNLVDLAGSENIARSGAQNKQARQAATINQSLLTLNRVITALVERRPHIPYRESKLTRILQDSLGGGTKTTMIATISPEQDDVADTFSTLDYATRARMITNRPELDRQIAQQTLSFHELESLKRNLANEIEIEVRKQVAEEFTREISKFQKEEREEKNKLIEMLSIEQSKLKEEREENNRISKLLSIEETKKKELTEELTKERARAEDLTVKLLKEQSNAAEFAQQAAELSKQLLTEQNLNQEKDSKISQLENEIKESSKLISTLEEKVEELREQASSRQAHKVKRATKIRKELPLQDDKNNYLNSTFDDDDELVKVSTKKLKPHPGLTMSGKKRKLPRLEDIDLSPITPPTRMTRSRATKRVLNF